MSPRAVAALERLGALAVVAFAGWLIYMAAAHGMVLWAVGGALVLIVLFGTWTRKAALVMVQGCSYDVKDPAEEKTEE